MDRFKISGPELQQHYPEGTHLSSVFGDIERELRATNQVVCQFIVNGMALREEDESKFSALSLADVHTLEYLTENSNNLVEGVIDGWIQAIPELIEKCDQFSRDLRQRGIRNHMKDVRDLIDNCEFLITSIISLKSILGDQVLAGVKGWLEAETKTQKALVEALGAFEKKDFVHLADVVEYDLNHGLQMWAEILISVQAIYTGKPVSSPSTLSHPLDRTEFSN